MLALVAGQPIRLGSENRKAQRFNDRQSFTYAEQASDRNRSSSTLR